MARPSRGSDYHVKWWSRFQLEKEKQGTFHSTQNSGYFSWCMKWNRPFRFGPTGIFETRFEGGPLWLVRLSGSVGPKCPFPFDKIVVPSTAVLYTAYKNNNQILGGLGRVCATGMYSSIGHVKFPKFQTWIFFEWKVPIVSPNTTFVLNTLTLKVHFFKSTMVFFEGIVIHIWETAYLPLP